MTPLDKFGQFVMRNLRDRAISRRNLQTAVLALPEDTQRVVLQSVADAIDAATHDFLFALQDAHDRKLGIEVSVDGANIAEVSDGLQGEPYGERGWIRKYSEYADINRDV